MNEAMKKHGYMRDWQGNWVRIGRGSSSSQMQPRSPSGLMWRMMARAGA